MSISKNLKKVLGDKGLNIKEFSEVTGIPYRSVQNYLLEDRAPSIEALNKLALSLNINLHWLITGLGDMYISEIQKDELSEQEIALLLSYRSCEAQTKQAIQSVADVLKTLLST